MKSKEYTTAIKIEKAVLTAVMVAWYVWMPIVGYGGEGCGDTAAYGTFMPHIIYMISHANVWHLLGNLFVLWIWRGRLHIVPSVVMAFVCSWLPVVPGLWDIGPAAEVVGTTASITVGFSGVLFAMAGIKWGQYCRRMLFKSQAFEYFCINALPFALLGIVIPHINWSIHLYCMLAGFAYGMMPELKKILVSEE